MVRKAFSLYEFTGKIKSSLNEKFDERYWIVGEISELRVNQNGHCYLELIEKEGNNIIARIRATIWSYSFRMIKPFFETSTGQPLAEGIKIMVQSSVEYHEVFGLSLNINEIDPAYTIGDMARKRQEIIQQLEDDGVIEMNKSLELPLLPQKIAIISSDTAAGYEDFVEQLEKNPHGYKFYHKLFRAYMQGEKTGDSIINALDKIYKTGQFFDLVVIIRGGGSKAELSSFDHYWLAFNIAQFPIPIITGIGHERDNSIADIVAHTSLKTPTAVAEFLIERMELAENELNNLHEDFELIIESILKEKKENIDYLAKKFIPLVLSKLQKNKMILENKSSRLRHSSKSKIENEKSELKHLKSKVLSSANVVIKTKIFQLTTSISKTKISINNKISQHKAFLEKAGYISSLSDPMKLLEKGYSITTKNGKTIKSIEEIESGEILQTRFKDGTIQSKTI